MVALKQEFCDCIAPGSVESIKTAYTAPQSIKMHLVHDAKSVKTIQSMLGIKDDGMWGDKTSENFYQKLATLQRDNGLKVTGEYTEDTAKIMRENGMELAAAALDKMKYNGTLDTVYNAENGQILCENHGTLPKNVTATEKDTPTYIQRVGFEIPAANDKQAYVIQSENSVKTPQTAMEGAIRNLQTSLGIDPTGKFSMDDLNKATDYITNFQEKNMRIPTGIPDEATIEAMSKNPETKDFAKAYKQLERELRGQIPSKLVDSPSHPETLIKTDIELGRQFGDAKANLTGQPLDIPRADTSPTVSVQSPRLETSAFGLSP